jgi:hypothetical protein
MILSIIITVLGLCLFETISSIDNAIINAEVLSGMGKKARRWFLTWGILVAVFLVRGLLPWLIVWIATPGLGPLEAFAATFSSDPSVHEAIERSRPPLLLGGGLFLVFLFLHWLFMEEKNFGLPHERFFMKGGAWFFAIAAVILALIVKFALDLSDHLAFAAVLGSTAFFITYGFKENAERQEAGLAEAALSDISKLLYLEIIDLTFSIDGVLGAFAFTLSVPIILVGNGLGAIIVRQMTIGNIDKIKRYRFLKNGAMYSILVLGTVMLAEGFGAELPEWLSPLATFVVVGAFLWKSVVAARREDAAAAASGGAAGAGDAAAGDAAAARDGAAEKAAAKDGEKG